MKITDKQRLDWMQRELRRQFFAVAFGLKVHSSIRSAIDAAIRASKPKRSTSSQVRG